MLSAEDMAAEGTRYGDVTPRTFLIWKYLLLETPQGARGARPQFGGSTVSPCPEATNPMWKPTSLGLESYGAWPALAHVVEGQRADTPHLRRLL